MSLTPILSNFTELAEIGRSAPISARSGSLLSKAAKDKFTAANEGPANVRLANVLVLKKMMQLWREIQISEDPDGPDPPDGAGAAGVHLGGGPSIRSSSGSQDEAIDTPNVLLRPLVRPVHGCVTAI